MSRKLRCVFRIPSPVLLLFSLRSLPLFLISFTFSPSLPFIFFPSLLTIFCTSFQCVLHFTTLSLSLSYKAVQLVFKLVLSFLRNLFTSSFLHSIFSITQNLLPSFSLSRPKNVIKIFLSHILSSLIRKDLFKDLDNVVSFEWRPFLNFVNLWKRGFSALNKTFVSKAKL